jgi:hypothetical protein
MIAPAAFEDLTFPEQKLNPWSGFESNQWLRATQNYFTSGSGNDVSYGTPTQIGSSYGFAAWNGTAMADNGKIYSSPHLSDGFLIIDTADDSISTTGSLGGGSPSTNGCFYSPITRCVYSATDDMRMYKMNIDTNAISYVSLPSYGSQWFPFVLSWDGLYAYSPGTYGTKNFVRYNLADDSYTEMSGATYSLDRGNTCLGVDNCVYAGAANGTSYVKYDIAANSVSNVGSFGGDTHPGMMTGPDGNMYGFPNNANALIRINVPFNTTTDVITPDSTCRATTQCIGADGNIYSVGDGSTCTVYNWRTNTLSTISLPTGGFHGIVMATSGDLYLIPWNDGNVVKIPINNNGRVLRPLQEFNGIFGRHQTGN